MLAADPYLTREVNLVTGLLLPVWSRLPGKSAQVRRVRAPDGRTDTASAVAAAGAALDMILEDGASVSLTGGFWLRRARVMDAWRIEVVGTASQRSAFQALGCVVEIINYHPRVFCPLGSEALARVLARWPAQSVIAKAA